jgi:hypothetical protein
VGPFGLGNGAFDGNMIDLPMVISMLPLGIKIVLEPPVIVRIVLWVGKLLVCC